MIHDMRNNKIKFDTRPVASDLIINDDILVVYEDGQHGLRTRCLVENWADMPQHSLCVVSALGESSIDEFERQQLDDYAATISGFEMMAGRGL